MRFGGVTRSNTAMQGRILAGRRKQKYQNIKFHPSSFPNLISSPKSVSDDFLTLAHLATEPDEESLAHLRLISAKNKTKQNKTKNQNNTKQMVAGAPWWEDWRTAPFTWQEAGRG